VAYDFGIKHNILRRLASFGCRLTVVPADYPAAKVLEMNPDGIFLSNGPVRAHACSDPCHILLVCMHASSLAAKQSLRLHCHICRALTGQKLG
jgi:carbamoylphosphate synthase small subunit